MPESSFPWVGGGPVTAGGWRSYHAGTSADGTMSDFDGTAFTPTVTGADKVVTVGPGKAVIQGAAYESSDAVNHNVGATGSAPTSGQYRWDLIVLRYDASQPIADRVKQAILPGTPSTTPAFPALTQDPDGIWESPLVWVKRGPGDISVTSGMVAKVAPWTAPTVYVPPSGDLPTGLPVGGVAFTDVNAYRRSPAGWVGVLDSPWTYFTAAAGITGSLRWRIQAGGVQVAGWFRRTGAAFPSNTWTAVATLPSAWATAGVRLSDLGPNPPVLPVTLTSDPLDTPFPSAVAPADVFYQYTLGTGTMYVRPRDSTVGRNGYVNHWLGPGADPRFA